MLYVEMLCLLGIRGKRVGLMMYDLMKILGLCWLMIFPFYCYFYFYLYISVLFFCFLYFFASCLMAMESVTEYMNEQRDL